MRRYTNNFFIICGLLLTLAAFPVFAQENQEQKINNKPFRELANLALQEISSKKISLSDSFLVELNGSLNESGKLAAQESVFVKSEGNEELVKISKKFIEAISESGLFGHLKKLGINKVNLLFAQDQNRIYGRIISETETADKARMTAIGLNTMVRLVQEKKDEFKQINETEKILINGFRADVEGKTITMNFSYEKDIIQNLINLKLKEFAQKVK